MTMRWLMIALILGTALLAFAKDPETTAQLQARVESADKNKQPQLYVQLAQRQIEDADTEYNSNPEQARKVLEQAIQSGEKAGETALSTGKSLKKVEIELRKASVRLGNLQRSWAVDDRAPIEAGIQRIEAARTKLLDRMFTK